MCLFNCHRKNKIIYANVYRNTINDGDSQTSPLPIFPEGGGTSVHRLHERSVWNQNFNCAAHKHNLKKNFKNWTWACDHLKTSNLSADNFKKYLTSMGRHLSPRYGQVIQVTGYPVLTAVNWSKHWCPICVHSQFSCAPKLAKKYEIEHCSRSSKTIYWSADSFQINHVPALRYPSRERRPPRRSHMWNVNIV